VRLRRPNRCTSAANSGEQADARHGRLMRGRSISLSWRGTPRHAQVELQRIGLVTQAADETSGVQTRSSRPAAAERLHRDQPSMRSLTFTTTGRWTS
jgi:hypothetical protein